MDFALRLSEERIKEAINNGEFNNLKNKGKPLTLEDLSSVPEELRMSYKILKNAGAIPEELALKKDILSLQDLIRCCVDDQEKSSLKRALNEKTIRFNMLMEKRKLGRSGAYQHYESKIRRKLF